MAPYPIEDEDLTVRKVPIITKYDENFQNGSNKLNWILLILIALAIYFFFFKKRNENKKDNQNQDDNISQTSSVQNYNCLLAIMDRFCDWCDCFPGSCLKTPNERQDQPEFWQKPAEDNRTDENIAINNENNNNNNNNGSKVNDGSSEEDITNVTDKEGSEKN